MKPHKRMTDSTSSDVYPQTERVVCDGFDYYYKTRDGGVSTAFDTRAAALYDLHNFILAASFEDELKNFSEISAG